MQIQKKPTSTPKGRIFAVPSAPSLFARAPHRKGLVPSLFLPTSLREMQTLGWDSCDIILITGDAYVDHPSFGMALVGRLLEAQGFRVGIVSQPNWLDVKDFQALGKPNLFFGVTAGNMDSMVNRYTADHRIRSDDAYTPGGEGGKRPDRSTLVYAQRCRQAFKGVPIILGGIEASLRRIAHFDYWSEKVRRSILTDAKADILLFGNAERALIEVAHRLGAGESIKSIQDVRGTAFMTRDLPEGWVTIDASTVDTPGPISPKSNPYTVQKSEADATSQGDIPVVAPLKNSTPTDFTNTAIRLPAFEMVKNDPILYAHASRILHKEANPGNARALVQAHGNRDLFLTAPPIPLTMAEMDRVYELPYTRRPHPSYGNKKIPAFDMIRFSITIQRGCFGGCTFCSITEHEGRIIQNRSKASILKEVKGLKNLPGYTGVISDLGGPTANMYRLACKSREVEAACRRPSCVFPKVCENLNTNHGPLIELYRETRATTGVKRVHIASGVRYDLAVEDPAYIKELVTHHVGGYLKIAPEHTQKGPLDKMMKPGIGTYERFKVLFDKYSREAGKKQYLIPYFIAAHPGTTDEDMVDLALWLKKNGYKADQVQTFLPSPMSTATAMYHSGKNPLKKVTHSTEDVPIPKGIKVRRLHKAFLRYHDPNNWPLLREALKRMKMADLIGQGPDCLIPSYQPRGHKVRGNTQGGRGQMRTQHTGLKNAATTEPSSDRNRSFGRRPKNKTRHRN